jgi:hypothetical protein
MLIIPYDTTVTTERKPSCQTIRQNVAGKDRKRINVNQDYEVQDWAKKFGVSNEELKAAVEAVGDQANAVEKHLKGRTHKA